MTFSVYAGLSGIRGNSIYRLAAILFTSVFSRLRKPTGLRRMSIFLCKINGTTCANHEYSSTSHWPSPLYNGHSGAHDLLLFIWSPREPVWTEQTYMFSIGKKKIRGNRRSKLTNSTPIKTGYPNLLHGCDFLCLKLMDYWSWEGLS